MLSFFRKNKKKPIPACMGLTIGHSFEIDPLFLKLVEDELTIACSATTHIIQAVGTAELDGNTLFRFYTDDDAFLQIVTQGGTEAEHVIDVKLFHYYDTQDMSSQTAWDNLLNKQLGNDSYSLENESFSRVWQSSSDYHPPVAMTETTFDAAGESSQTDQFTMLYERPLKDGSTEALFLSAEESIENQQLERCFVRSTGITLSPSQITLHG